MNVVWVFSFGCANFGMTFAVLRLRKTNAGIRILPGFLAGHLNKHTWRGSGLYSPHRRRTNTVWLLHSAPGGYRRDMDERSVGCLDSSIEHAVRASLQLSFCNFTSSRQTGGYSSTTNQTSFANQLIHVTFDSCLWCVSPSLFARALGSE